jgi:hypothetical protein
MIDLGDLKDKAQASKDLGCHDDFHGVHSAFRRAASADTVLALIRRIEELEKDLKDYRKIQAWEFDQQLL